MSRRALPGLVLCMVIGCGSSSSSDAASTDAGPTRSEAGADDAGAADDALDAPADDAPAPADPTWDALLAFARTEIVKNAAPGVSIAIVRDGKLVHSAGVGVKRAGGAEPLDGRSLFRVGSITKMVVAATAMSLVEEGKLDLDAPVTRYVPFFKRATGFDPSTVLLRHAMSHQSGVPDEGPVKCEVGEKAFESWFGTLHANDALWSPPGAVWDYSNPGFALTAAAIEGVTKQRFESAVASRVFAKANMTTATMDPATAMAVDHTTGHTPKGPGTYAFSEIDGYDCEILRAAGGVIASVEDYAHLAEQFLADGGAVLTPASMTAMESQVDTHEFPGQRYGFGLFTGPDWRGLRVVEHNGLVPGFTTWFTMVPDRRFAVIVFSNLDAYQPESIVRKAMELYLAAPITPPPTWTTPSSTWTKYLGTYVDPYGMIGTIKITVDVTGTMWADSTVLPAKVPMAQIADDFFVIHAGKTELPATFYLDAAGSGQWLVTRAGVGKRDPTKGP